MITMESKTRHVEDGMAAGCVVSFELSFHLLSCIAYLPSPYSISDVRDPRQAKLTLLMNHVHTNDPISFSASGLDVPGSRPINSSQSSLILSIHTRHEGLGFGRPVACASFHF